MPQTPDFIPSEDPRVCQYHTHQSVPPYFSESNRNSWSDTSSVASSYHGNDVPPQTPEYYVPQFYNRSLSELVLNQCPDVQNSTAPSSGVSRNFSVPSSYPNTTYRGSAQTCDVSTNYDNFTSYTSSQTVENHPNLDQNQLLHRKNYGFPQENTLDRNMMY